MNSRKKLIFYSMSEYQTPVQERRHSDITYLPFVVSIRELIE